MIIVEKSFQARDIEAMEEHLIAELKKNTMFSQSTCLNIHRGGNGGMRRKPPPYYTYVVVGKLELRDGLVSDRSHFLPKDNNRLRSTEIISSSDSNC
jgi:hypothetical protein